MKKIWYAPYKFESYGKEEIKAVEDSLKSGWLGGQGPRSVKFEKEIAKKFGKKYGVFVNSGSSACLLAIAALDLPKGCKIITPACTFATTLAPIIQLGYVPVFVDVDLTSYCATVDDIMKVVDKEVKAIMLPNLIGNKPDWDALKSALLSMDRFNHIVDGIPYDHKFLYGVLGYHMKACEMNAAFGLVQLKRFKKFSIRRRLVFERYLENLQGVGDLILPDDSLKPNWLAIPFQTNKRFELLTFLENNNIQTRVTFAGNVTRHPIYRNYLQEFKNADTIMKNGFLLGAHHGMTVDDVDYVCDKIKEFFES